MTQPRQKADEDRFAEQLEQLHREVQSDADATAVQTSKLRGDKEPDPIFKARKVLGLIQRVRKAKESEQQGTFQQETAVEQTTPRDKPESRGAANVLTDESIEQKKIDRFLIRRQLGQGGYGLVFLAFDPQLDRDVALKIPRPEVLMNASLRSRFIREAKAAASLSHPNIVPVFESGGDGTICFIAYEFVEGTTLAQWLSKFKDTALLDPQDAARLVVTLADAMEHAHQRGVLHRDLKPTNVMLKEKKGASTVSATQVKESEGQKTGDKLGPFPLLFPMITDFGLAKIVASDEMPAESVDQTRTGAIVGTPAYMAPENFKSENELIGPATDIYSLGVLFYELLTLSNPFVRDSLIKTMGAVQTHDPVPPSRLNPKISRDLDAVVLKCLEKNTTDRYATAADLRTDLERFLNREPVQARKITAAIRSARWISRNRFVTILLCLMMLGMLGTTIGLVRARQAEADARVAEQDAIVEAKTAVTVSDFLKDIFEVSDLLGGKPSEQRGREITAEEILKHGTVKIRTELDDQPKVKARLMTTIGSILVKIGSYEEGESLLRDALSLQVEVLGSDDPELAISHRQLAKVLLLKERIEEAEIELRSAIEILELDIESNYRELSVTYNDLGLVLRTSNLDGARNAYQKARDLRANDNSSNLWRLDVNIGAIDARLGRFESARDVFERALEGATQAHGSLEHPAFATILNNLAFVHRKLGNYHQARELQERDLRLSEKTLGGNHPKVGVSLINLTAVCQRLGDYGAAAEYGERAIEVNSANLPPEHRYISMSLHHHATTQMRIGEYEKARTLVEQAMEQLAIRQDKDAAFSRIRNRLLLATIERWAGDAGKALELVDQVLADPVVDENQKTGMDARFARALALAQMDNEQAGTEFEVSLRFADDSPGLLPQDRAYFEARFWALAGDTDKALTKLEEAVDNGHHDALLLTDPDLVSVRTDRRYARLALQIEDALNGKEY